LNLPLLSSLLLLVAAGQAATGNENSQEQVLPRLAGSDGTVTLFLCGDVMTGRGIDQILPHPSDPRIHEPFVHDAREYVRIAEQSSGPIPLPVDFSYVWGDALGELAHKKPDLRLINLETSITTSNAFWPGKGINYRMHPGNVACLTEAHIDFCSLANNHTLDWGYAGLAETIETLTRAGIVCCGAGARLAEARKPAVLEVQGEGRLIVFALCSTSSGVPATWAATDDTPGVDLIRDLSDTTIHNLAERFRRVKHAGDLLICSIHWGGNWGYEVPAAHRSFAHRLIDDAGVDLVCGHSSHHPRPIEVYRGRLILYGCGDFINDYEGIAGYESFRGDLVLMYFPRIEWATGRLIDLQMTPLQTKRFRLQRAARADAAWLRDTLNRCSGVFGSQVILGEDNRLYLHW
jgi:poly-gamma-glutamate capsule biosynthesis protein CapA/YwtB (metallophosphatase superfamily)